MMLFKSVPNAICVAVSFLVALGTGLLSQKVKWLGNFIIAICMIAGMVAGVIAQNLL